MELETNMLPENNDEFTTSRLNKILDFAKQNRLKWEIEAYVNMEFVE